MNLSESFLEVFGGKEGRKNNGFDLHKCLFFFPFMFVIFSLWRFIFLNPHDTAKQTDTSNISNISEDHM